MEKIVSVDLDTETNHDLFSPDTQVYPGEEAPSECGPLEIKVCDPRSHSFDDGGGTQIVLVPIGIRNEIIHSCGERVKQSRNMY